MVDGAGVYLVNDSATVDKIRKVDIPEGIDYVADSRKERILAVERIAPVFGKMVNLQESINQLECQLESEKRQLRFYKEEIAIDLLDEFAFSEIAIYDKIDSVPVGFDSRSAIIRKVATGKRAYLSMIDVVFCSVKEEQSCAAFTWLSMNGHSDKIKTQHHEKIDAASLRKILREAESKEIGKGGLTEIDRESFKVFQSQKAEIKFKK